MENNTGARKCAECDGRLVHKNAEGVNFRIDGPVRIDELGVCHARCHWCKAEVAIPLELSKSFVIQEERVVVLTRAPMSPNVRK